MASIDYKTGVERKQSLTAESMFKVWVSPSTANAGDTVTLPTINNRTARVVVCTKNGTAVATPISGNVVTLESGGSATSQTYVLTYMYQ
jgi:hypothetical protein